MCAVSISGGCCVTGKSSVFVVFLGGQTKYLQISFCDKMFQNSAGKLVDNLRFLSLWSKLSTTLLFASSTSVEWKGRVQIMWSGSYEVNPALGQLTVWCFVTNRKAELQTPNPTPACPLVNGSHWELALSLSLPAQRAISALFQVLYCRSAAHSCWWEGVWVEGRLQN